MKKPNENRQCFAWASMLSNLLSLPFAGSLFCLALFYKVFNFHFYVITFFFCHSQCVRKAHNAILPHRRCAGAASALEQLNSDFPSRIQNSEFKRLKMRIPNQRDADLLVRRTSNFVQNKLSVFGLPNG